MSEEIEGLESGTIDGGAFYLDRTAFEEIEGVAYYSEGGTFRPIFLMSTFWRWG